MTKGVIANPPDDYFLKMTKMHLKFFRETCEAHPWVDVHPSNNRYLYPNYIKKTVNKNNPYTLTIGWLEQSATMSWGYDMRVQYPTLEKAKQMQKMFQQMTKEEA